MKSWEEGILIGFFIISAIDYLIFRWIEFPELRKRITGR